MILLSSIAFYMIGGAATIIVPVIIILSTFLCGKLIEKTTDKKRKKLIFLVGLIINLGLLVFYKYFNFFLATFFDGYDFITKVFWAKQAVDHSSFFLQLAIPLGISYITFQAIGYLVEIHWGNHKPENNLAFFATYLFFFPKLLSGPIERAHNFIPQLRQKHNFDYDQVVIGLKRILWGLFLKLVVADRLALYTDSAFNNYELHSGVTLLIASIFFTIQLFADFAGYTSMAIGSAQILGFHLMENFDNPFIAKSLTEFWRRWHISLTTWVTDYIYNPIAINRRNWNKWAQVFAAMVTFLILGFWHGASWNFIIFGLLHGFVLSIEYLTRKFRKQLRNKIPLWLNDIMGICFTFMYFSFTTVFFKADNANDAFMIIKRIFTEFGVMSYNGLGVLIFSVMGIAIIVLHGIANVYYPQVELLYSSNKYISFFSILFLLIYITSFGVFDGSQFIYFKF